LKKHNQKKILILIKHKIIIKNINYKLKMSQVKPETINNNQPTQNDTEAKPINPPQSKDTKEAKESGKEETNKPRRFSVIMGLQNLGLNNNDDDDDDDYEEDEEEQR
jgi:hypothetical protein